MQSHILYVDVNTQIGEFAVVFYDSLYLSALLYKMYAIDLVFATEIGTLRI